MKKKVERLDLQLLGRCQLSVATDETNDVDLSRHKAATAPNLIHSLDASLLHLAVRSFDEPIALIHDSVLSRCCDMDKLSAIIRETYMLSLQSMTISLTLPDKSEQRQNRLSLATYNPKRL